MQSETTLVVSDIVASAVSFLLVRPAKDGVSLCGRGAFSIRVPFDNAYPLKAHVLVRRSIVYTLRAHVLKSAAS